MQLGVIVNVAYKSVCLARSLALIVAPPVRSRGHAPAPIDWLAEMLRTDLCQFMRVKLSEAHQAVALMATPLELIETDDPDNLTTIGGATEASKAIRSPP